MNAANRAVNMLQDHEFSVKVALMPDNLDPDDYIKEFGEKSFVSEVMGASLTYMAFKMHYLRRGKNVNNEGDRIQYIEEVLKEISRLPNAVERDHYLRQLSSEFFPFIGCAGTAAASGVLYGTQEGDIAAASSPKENGPAI
ncbi:hypothetical protein RCO48_05785 [Peribacillus frigoritolerans]|nr:hypothetical protein [Peribacillus frigoritolerans]